MTFTFDYQIYDDRNNLIKSGTVRLKNKHTELEAKMSAEKNLRILCPKMKSLVLTPRVHNPFGDIFNGFI